MLSYSTLLCSSSSSSCSPSHTKHTQQPAETTALLTRLASKPGVQSTLILSKADGSIIRTSGLISQTVPSSPSASLKCSLSEGVVPNSGSLNGRATAEMGATENSNGYEEGRESGGAGMKSAEEMARMVWNFVDAAGGLVVGLDVEDEVKLLRLRTKKNELVIVPGELRLRFLWRAAERIGSGANLRSKRRLEVPACGHTRNPSRLMICSTWIYTVGSGVCRPC